MSPHVAGTSSGHSVMDTSASTHTSVPAFGTSLVQPFLLDSVSRLWQGPLHPLDLPQVELCLRAFLVSPRLSLLRFGLGKNVDDFAHLFKDLFIDQNIKMPRLKLPGGELDYLSDFALSRMNETFLAIFPTWFRTENQAESWFNAWYEGLPGGACDMIVRQDYSLGRDRKKFDREDFCRNNILFAIDVEEDASYLVECHRSGYSVYAIGPLATLCNEHIFSRWPNRLFDQCEEAYRETMRELRGPGIGVELPPLTSMLLSVSPSRQSIPMALAELREMYEDLRNDLWQTLTEMWTAGTVKQQLKHLRKLEDVSKHMFSAAFPDRIPAMSLAFEAAKLSPAGGIGIAKHLLERPRARVSAISFAARLADDLHRHLMS